MQDKLDRSEDWRLRRRADLSGGKVAFGVIGDGPPVVLVHGTPSRSFIWREVALAEGHAVHVFDLLGFGDSEKREGMDTSIPSRYMRTVRIVWGERDAWLDLAFARRLDELLPNSDLELIPQAGHFAMEDRPDELARTLVEFFSDE